MILDLYLGNNVLKAMYLERKINLEKHQNDLEAELGKVSAHLRV